MKDEVEAVQSQRLQILLPYPRKSVQSVEIRVPFLAFSIQPAVSDRACDG